MSKRKKINRRCININELDKIKSVKGEYLYLAICDKGREGVVIPSKYGPEWWKKATKSDLRRVMVK